MTAADALKQAGMRNVFGPLMVEAGDADGVISGLTQHYPETIRPALEIVGTAPGVRRVSGLYTLVFKDRTFFFADTTVNIEPTAEDLAEIALLTAEAVHVLQRAVEVADIVNMAAIAVVDAQEKAASKSC